MGCRFGGRSKFWVLGDISSPPPAFSGSVPPSPIDLRIVLGTNDLQSPSLEVKGVTSIVIHKDFERATMDNDIALLLLDTDIRFNGLKEPICMPRQPGPAKWSKCWVAGWGQTRPGMRLRSSFQELLGEEPITASGDGSLNLKEAGGG